MVELYRLVICSKKIVSVTNILTGKEHPYGEVTDFLAKEFVKSLPHFELF
jgi:hypothetical protein